VFFHDKRLQYWTEPERPDPVFARQLQEVIGGQWGEMSVAMAYLFQGWNCRGPKKYRDMILDIGTEEIGHVEMLATMVNKLLTGAEVGPKEQVAKDSMTAAILGGMDPQHVIVGGFGAMPADSNGNRWTADYIIASGNMLADFRYNVAAESQGRLQVTRLYELTEDEGVRDFLSFLIARDTMHQNQWLAAIEELEKDGLEMTPCPSTFPQKMEKTDVSYQFWNCSEGTESKDGRWASGKSIDGKGKFEYVEKVYPLSGVVDLEPAPPQFHGTGKMKVPPVAGVGAHGTNGAGGLLKKIKS
jgi:Mn-containing catalase